MVKRLYLEAKFFGGNAAHTYLTLRDEGDMTQLLHRQNALVIRGGPEKFPCWNGDVPYGIHTNISL